jgi:hypothetical protein
MSWMMRTEVIGLGLVRNGTAVIETHAFLGPQPQPFDEHFMPPPPKQPLFGGL